MQEIELAWAAGFFDGEGSTVANRQGTERRPDHRQFAPRRSYLRLEVKQAADPGHDGPPEVLVRLQAVLGGSIGGPYIQKRSAAELATGQGRRRPLYLWYSSRATADVALGLLWPFLGTVKRDQAERARGIIAADHEAFGHTRLCGHAA